jgi:DNA helicase HerA-like ATPase
MCVSKKRQPSLPDSSAPREHWGNTVLVCIDEAHLLAPHMAASARDAETRRLGVATLTDMCARGRKRGIGTIIATQRLAKLASSVVSELHNHLIGLNVFDRDVARAADLLGFGSEQAGLLRQLAPGEFFAFGPALSPLPQLARIDPTITRHIGHSPALLSAADLDPQQSRSCSILKPCALPVPVGRRRWPPGAPGAGQFPA